MDMIKSIYNKYKDSKRVKELQKKEFTYIPNRYLTITTLIEMLKRAKTEVLLSTKYPIFESTTNQIINNVECALKKGVMFKIFYLSDEKTNKYLKQIKLLQKKGMLIRIVSSEYESALDTMRFICVDRRECMILYSMPTSNFTFGVYINNKNLVESYIKLFMNIWEQSIIA